MNQMHRLVCILLLLVVLAAQIFGGAHAAIHSGSDTGGCVLCATYGSASAALSTAVLLPLPVSILIPSFDFVPLAESTSAILCNHQRGPPPGVS